MNNIEFANKAIKLSKEKTAYMLGSFCWSATDSNIKRLLNQYEDNYKWLWKADQIKGQGYIGDCIGIIKGLLWGFSFDLGKPYGGAVYCSNGIPDIDADSAINICSNVTSNLNNAIEGEVVWMPGHIGIVVSSTQVVECTPIGSCGVQITNLHTRGWKKKGRLPWISYSAQNGVPSPTLSQNSAQVAYAQSFNKVYARTYTINAVGGLNIRTNAGVQYTKIKTLPNGSKVTCHGYYTLDANKTKWYLVVAQDSTTGFVSSDFLK